MSISSKDDKLIIISIDPVTRATLHARIVYRREPAAMIFPRSMRPPHRYYYAGL
jgi:hypothetical protein